jgi:phosphotriesterase-related protein
MGTRRSFLAASAAVALGRGAAAQEEPRIRTVRGPIDPGRLGVTLIHEHVLVDFIGADKVSPDRYEPDEVFRVALPHLRRARELGCRALVECTPDYLGRDPALLRRLSEAADLHLLTNTGYYGAAGGKYLPAHAHAESAEQLAARWIREARDGIGRTGIRPGFIKIGVDGAPLPEVNRKLVRAAALTHRATGLTVHQHTGSGAAAMEALDILAKEGVSPEAFVWVHAQAERDPALHAEAARRGAWVEFDGVGPQSIEQHVRLVTALRERGHLRRALVSHDAGWYNVGEPGGGNYRGYDALFTDFVPALKRAGVSEDEVKELLETNPRRALAPRVRRTGPAP